MGWTAIVPLKHGADRKSRLAARLSVAERIALSERMVRHVLAVLAALPDVTDIAVLSPQPVPELPARWLEDKGRGLNEELTAARGALGDRGLVVLHADLPLVERDDISALIAAAEAFGAAIAPDRHGTGSNAVALTPGTPFVFAFGPGSFRRHMADAQLTVVDRPRLSIDIDTPGDLDTAAAHGFSA